ncbi:hypothetical protein EGW08_003031 [Elysia chlorotica]|uniref:RAD51 interacting motif domain-containing protein n=1 Tax=Elysia chlorotica TaxID=188477 RepID=A0A3S0ZXM5_ELYCH|nr:hypothetical protein EGW08_003031 [Elysia chlorotica]
MTERRSSRPRKIIKIPTFDDLSDDDFADATPPPPKKQRSEKSADKKVPSKNKEVSLGQTVADVYESSDSGNGKKKRMPLSDKIYERELQQALEMSLIQSQSSQDSDTKSTKSDTLASKPDNTKDAENTEPPGAAVKHIPGVIVEDKIEPLEENVKSVSKGTRDRPQRCSKTQGKQKAAPAQSKLRLDSDDDDDDEYASENDEDDESEEEEDSDDSDFGYDSKPAKNKRTPAKKVKTPVKKAKTGSEKTKPSTASLPVKPKTSSAAPFPVKPKISSEPKISSAPVPAKVPASHSLSKAASSAKKMSSSTPSHSLTVPSSLTSSWKPPAFSGPGSSSLPAVKSPTSGLRLGLSRNHRVKPLHPSVRAT